jgi:glutathione peroxidase-family protein
MAQIFESPDKGKTVYARNFGEHFSKRKLIKSPGVAEEPLYERLAKDNDYGRVRKEKF